MSAKRDIRWKSFPLIHFFNIYLGLFLRIIMDCFHRSCDKPHRCGKARSPRLASIVHTASPRPLPELSSSRSLCTRSPKPSAHWREKSDMCKNTGRSKRAAFERHFRIIITWPVLVLMEALCQKNVLYLVVCLVHARARNLTEATRWKHQNWTHLPKIHNSVGQRSLGGNVSWLAGVMVKLKGKQMRVTGFLFTQLIRVIRTSLNKCILVK